MDIKLLINEFLKDKENLRTEHDSVNIVNNKIVHWDFENISKPTLKHLKSFEKIVNAQKHNREVIKKIQDLENSITPRMMREALLSGNLEELKKIDSQIIELRTKLK